MNPGGGLRVEAKQDAVQVSGAFLFRLLAEADAEFFGALRSREQAFKKSAEVEASASDDDGEILALANFGEGFARHAGIFSGGNVAGGIDEIQEMMRGAGAFCGSRLGGADFEFAVHGHGIAIDDFSVEMFGEGEGKRGLSGGGWAEDYD